MRTVLHDGCSEKVHLRNHSIVVGDTNTDVQSFIYLLNRTNDHELRSVTGEGCPLLFDYWPLNVIVIQPLCLAFFFWGTMNVLWCHLFIYMAFVVHLCICGGV